MPISLNCPSCDKPFRTSDANAGKRGKCPECGTAIQIPARAEEPEELEPAEVRTRPSARRGSSRSDEEPEPTFRPLALLFGALAALLGAGTWALVLLKTEYEIGWIAWGVGGLVGTAVVKAGGRGMPMAVTAAALALLGIAGGKWVGMAILLDQELSGGGAPDIAAIVRDNTTPAMFRGAQADAELWVAFEEPPTDDVLASWMINRDYVEAESPEQVDPEILEWFRSEEAAYLEEFHASPPTYDEWVELESARIRGFMAGSELEAVTAIDLVVANLGPLDLLFIGLGIATAWSIVMKARR